MLLSCKPHCASRMKCNRLAKAEAAREGITLTRFIEEALALRLRQAPTLQPPGALPVFRGGPRFHRASIWSRP